MEEKIACVVRTAMEQYQYETHENKVYSVCSRGESVDKTALKSKFKQGDRDLLHTEVRIIVGEELNVVFENSPLYIYGEYRKMSRNMTQTPLKINGRLKCKRSVSDFHTQVKSFFLADCVTFIPAGREDFDVRMIEGRPFLLAVRNPKRNLEFTNMNLDLYSDLDITELKVVNKECKKIIFSGEGEAKKTYRAFICCKKELELQKIYKIEQRTPLRVLHRRANLSRDKEIQIVEWDKIVTGSWIYYLVTLEASAGAYIKEFVNGDFGRTVPSLGNRDNYCDLLELDVLRVEKKDVAPFVLREISLQISNRE